MNLKKLALSLLAVAALWSCSKDDGPSTPTGPTVTSFTPEQGPVGTLVTVNGTNFATTAAANTVKLGSATASISGTPTATKLTITVPQGATSGKISVTVGGKTDTSTKTFTVTEPDPTNNPPVIADQAFEVVESIADTEGIGTVTATDQDQDELTFSITENDNDRFEITPEGVLSLTAGTTLDFAEQAQHVITVQVSDGKGGTATAKVSINVTEDMAPTGAVEYEFSVAETIADDQTIGVITAEDPEGNAIAYQVEDSDLFEINADGELSLIEGTNLDYEAKTVHNITVIASDGLNELEIFVTVIVEDITSAEDPSTFVTKWVTEQNGEAVIIYLSNDYAYDFTIDWGDGTVEKHQYNINDAVFVSHAYDMAGDHLVSIQGNFPAITMKDSPSADKLVGIQQWGNIQWRDMESAFYGCTNLSEYTATDVPDLSNVDSMKDMFRACTQFNGAIGDWDTSHVKNMLGVFNGANSFNQDIGNWDTSNVIDMSFMFRDAFKFNQDIGDWDVLYVSTMLYMFANASDFNQNIGGWDTSNVTNMQGMFFNAISFNQNVGDWDITSLESAFSMFNNAGMSPENLSSTFIGWNNFVEQNNGPQNIFLGVDNLVYCGNDALLAADNLFSNHGWQFDGNLGYQVDCN
jgi:surface protein